MGPMSVPPSHTAAAAAPIYLSVVVPAYNEEEVLAAFHTRLSAVLDQIPGQCEVVYVNDGSTDGTLALMNELRSRDGRVAIVDLSRNFGKEIATSSGFDHARGESVALIDADLQDPPEFILTMLEYRQRGFDVVCAQRIARDGESWFKRFSAYAFYRIVQRMSPVRIPEDVGDFRILSRRAVDALLQIREQHRFLKGLFAWIGFPQVLVPYSRDARFAGHTKWNYWRLWNFAIEGITSFSTGPLKLATYGGILIALIAFFFVVVVVYKTLLYGDPVKGYPSMMVTILFLGGLQLICIGILGEYLGRIFNETKRRPLYLLKGFEPAKVSGVGGGNEAASRTEEI